MQLLDPIPPAEPTTEAMEWITNSTLAVSGPVIFGGYVMGIGFSLISSLISAEMSTQTMGMKHYFRYSMRSAHRLGANFAMFGFVFQGMEAAMEKRRARRDMWNPTASGAILGGVYGWRSYRRIGLVGGTIGGGVASYIIELLMHRVFGDG